MERLGRASSECGGCSDALGGVNARLAKAGELRRAAAGAPKRTAMLNRLAPDVARPADEGPRRAWAVEGLCGLSLRPLSTRNVRVTPGSRGSSFEEVEGSGE